MADDSIYISRNDIIFSPDFGGRFYTQQGTTCWLDSTLFLLQADNIRQLFRSKCFIYNKHKFPIRTINCINRNHSRRDPKTGKYGVISDPKENIYWYTLLNVLLKINQIRLTTFSDIRTLPRTKIIEMKCLTQSPTEAVQAGLIDLTPPDSSSCLCVSLNQIAYDFQQELSGVPFIISKESGGYTNRFIFKMFRKFKLDIINQRILGDELDKKVDLTTNAFAIIYDHGGKLQHCVAVAKINDKYFYFDNEMDVEKRFLTLKTRDNCINLKDKTYRNMLTGCVKDINITEVIAIIPRSSIWDHKRLNLIPSESDEYHINVDSDNELDFADNFLLGLDQVHRRIFQEMALKYESLFVNIFGSDYPRIIGEPQRKQRAQTSRRSRKPPIQSSSTRITRTPSARSVKKTSSPAATTSRKAPTCSLCGKPGTKRNCSLNKSAKTIKH